MVIGIKDTAKLLGISIISCCAVLVCTMFMNFYFDIRQIEDRVAPGQAMILYQAQLSTAKVVCLVTGGCLLLTSVIMLFFYIKHYIDTHRKELGILKALGYSDFEVAVHFWMFGISVLTGTAAGFGGAFLLMPRFYELQNADGLLPEIVVRFHLPVLIYFVVLPTAAFALLAILYACRKLRRPTITLLRESPETSARGVGKWGDRERPFLEELKKTTLRSKKTLAFFIIFASFCYSAMTQMSFSMKDLSSEMMGAMMLIIGLVLAFVTLFLAITTVVRGNTRAIAMMRVFGYSHRECCQVLLGGYRPLGYIGFVLGTGYQYALLRVMVDIVFRDMEGVPVYKFDVPMMFLSLISFIAVYEVIMFCYAGRIKKVSVKEIMMTD